MTKKQKEEQRAAELRKQALLASGVQIEGLQQQNTSQTSKKVVYGNRKKKGPVNAAGGSGPTTREPSVEPASPAPVTEVLPAEVVAPTAEAVKDDWDASSEGEESKIPEGIKESWDASSDEEVERPASQPKGKMQRPHLFIDSCFV